MEQKSFRDYPVGKYKKKKINELTTSEKIGIAVAVIADKRTIDDTA